MRWNSLRGVRLLLWKRHFNLWILCTVIVLLLIRNRLLDDTQRLQTRPIRVHLHDIDINRLIYICAIELCLEKAGIFQIVFPHILLLFPIFHNFLLRFRTIFRFFVRPRHFLAVADRFALFVFLQLLVHNLIQIQNVRLITISLRRVLLRKRFQFPIIGVFWRWFSNNLIFIFNIDLGVLIHIFQYIYDVISFLPTWTWSRRFLIFFVIF